MGTYLQKGPFRSGAMHIWFSQKGIHKKLAETSIVGGSFLLFYSIMPLIPTFSRELWLFILKWAGSIPGLAPLIRTGTSGFLRFISTGTPAMVIFHVWCVTSIACKPTCRRIITMTSFHHDHGSWANYERFFFLSHPVFFAVMAFDLESMPSSRETMDG